MSLNESVFTAAPGLGILLGGAVTAIAGPRPALAVAAGGSLAIIVLAWILLPRRASRVLATGTAGGHDGGSARCASPKTAARR